MRINMKIKFIFIPCLLTLFSFIDNSYSENPVDTKILRVEDQSNQQISYRKKRYVAFPEGSEFTAAFCETLGAIGDPQYPYMSWAFNWGIAYELPNETFVTSYHSKKHMPKPVMQRRYRRDLYNKIERIIDSMGRNGRQCVLRALCESSQYFQGKGTNLIAELVRSIFSLPKMKVLDFEHSDIKTYDMAHRKGRNNVYCHSLYSDCSFSLIELALGSFTRSYNFM